MISVKKLSLTLMVSTITSLAAAQSMPAVVYDQAGKNDKSFNEAVYRNGVMRYEEDSGKTVKEFEPQNEAQMEQGLRKMAKAGFSPIVAVGFTFASAVDKVAQEFPETKFTLIDMVVMQPNVQSIVFKEHEGSFLVGALAALASQSNKVGFVGGMDIPLIRKFACGYAQGAKHISAEAMVFENMTGSTPAAWSDPAKGAELAKSQFSKGADVVFAAAGGTGLGVYQAAKDNGHFAIGVDSNQNYVQPGTMLTSMVKRVGTAAYLSWQEAEAGTWQAGVKVLGLAEGGVDWALDEHNRDLISAEHEAMINEIKSKIIAQEIAVHDYMATNSCP